MYIKVQRVEQQLIPRGHPKYKIIDEMCKHSKDLYNYANYILRQEFISNNKYISYYQMNSNLKTHELYKACMSQPANCVLRALDKNWKSFFVAIKDWNKHKDKYLGMPKPPKYLKKNGRFNWMIPNNSCYIEGNDLHFRIRKLQDYHWKCRNLGRLIQVRFVPKGSCYMMEIVYEVEIDYHVINDSTRICSIDLGVNNFVTMTNNIGNRPIIINGKGIKSINQHYNKVRAKEQSRLMIRHGKTWSRKLDDITQKRFRKIKNYIHNTSSFIIKYCIKNNIDTIVIGKNKEWKQNCDMGKINNQKFIQIPFEMLINQLNYKCEDNNIKLIETNESYTSGTSFLDNEEPVKNNYDKSRRVERGLFQCNNGRLINSDVNGSLQIMKKVFSNAISYEIGANLTPIVINATAI